MTTALPFAALPHDLVSDPRLNTRAIQLAAALLRYARAKDHCWPSNATLGGVMNCCERTIQMGLRALAGAGWVKVERTGTNPTHRLIRLAWRKPAHFCEVPPSTPAGGNPQKYATESPSSEKQSKETSGSGRPAGPARPVPGTGEARSCVEGGSAGVGEKLVREAWVALPEEQREVIRAQVRAVSPEIERWPLFFEANCLGALEQQLSPAPPEPTPAPLPEPEVTPTMPAAGTLPKREVPYSQGVPRGKRANPGGQAGRLGDSRSFRAWGVQFMRDHPDAWDAFESGPDDPPEADRIRAEFERMRRADARARAGPRMGPGGGLRAGGEPPGGAGLPAGGGPGGGAPAG